MNYSLNQLLSVLGNKCLNIKCSQANSDITITMKNVCFNYISFIRDVVVVVDVDINI